MCLCASALLNTLDLTSKVHDVFTYLINQIPYIYQGLHLPRTFPPQISASKQRSLFILLMKGGKGRKCI